ncbi:VWA domain-containing protein [Brevibacillus antibioticus]|uniref:VWA domain-containing protein n=1 Tax=Brevibacillus antibioticus TaxID=2570228 RepID=A0A4U2YD82_9BACL|nr:VWA domain-containing protein [Brevibacillus antibioticus]TKI58827.1 VWA domain-containing protein [Brevibacillus antibioticus]
MRKIMKASGITLLVTSLIGCSSSEQFLSRSESGNKATASVEQGQNNQVASSPSPPSQLADYALKKSGDPLPNDMYFKDYGTNQFVPTAKDRLSTFAADVDSASYTMMRNFIKDGNLPLAEAVRVEEFINFFPTSYPAPTNQTFAIQADSGPSPFQKNLQVVRIGIKGKELRAEERKPATLVFVIDVSGSMNQENRLELVKKSLHVLVDQLQPTDSVGLVVYGSEGRVLLPPTSAEDKHAILSAIDQLQPEGSTNAEEGLVLGYEMAARAFKPGAINRVILCSDGVANVGETGAEGILRSIEDYARKDIYLSTFGFGMGNYNDVLMEQLANKGEGSYAYIDTFSEARRIFMESLTGTLQTIARDVKIQVEFDPKKVDSYRLIGYENRDVRDKDFRNDKTDAGEVGAGHSVTALYEVKLSTPVHTDLGTVRVRYHNASSQKVEEISEPVKVQNALSPDVTFLAAVAEYGEILREGPYAERSSLPDVLKLAEATATGEEQLEFVRLVKDSMAISRN